jgi:hypothetical protein
VLSLLVLLTLALGSVVLAAELLVIGLAFLIVAPLLLVSVPGLVVLVAGMIFELEIALVERVRRRWFPIRVPPSTRREVQPWSAEREIIDAEYRAQIGYQLEALIAYRNECLTLTGFLGVIASATVAFATVAVTTAFLVGTFVNLGLFVCVSIHGKRILDDYPPDPAEPTRISKIMEEAGALSAVDAAPGSLRAIALQEREIAYQANLNSLEWRKRLLSQVRAIILVAVAVLSVTAVAEARPAKDGQAMAITTTGPHATLNPHRRTSSRGCRQRQDQHRRSAPSAYRPLGLCP